MALAHLKSLAFETCYLGNFRLKEGKEDRHVNRAERGKWHLPVLILLVKPRLHEDKDKPKNRG